MTNSDDVQFRYNINNGPSVIIPGPYVTGATGLVDNILLSPGDKFTLELVSANNQTAILIEVTNFIVTYSCCRINAVPINEYLTPTIIFSSSINNSKVETNNISYFIGQNLTSMILTANNINESFMDVSHKISDNLTISGYDITFRNIKYLPNSNFYSKIKATLFLSYLINGVYKDPIETLYTVEETNIKNDCNGILKQINNVIINIPVHTLVSFKIDMTNIKANIVAHIKSKVNSSFNCECGKKK